AEKIFERRPAPLYFNKDPVLPDAALGGHQPARRAVKPTHAREVRRPLQLAFERVRPAVIRATKRARLALLLGHHGGGVVAADVEEAAQDPIAPADDDQRLARDLARHVTPRPPHLLRAPDHLPRAREDRPPLQLVDARVRVPGRGDRPSPRERRARVVALDDFSEWSRHEFST